MGTALYCLATLHSVALDTHFPPLGLIFKSMKASVKTLTLIKVHFRGMMEKEL